MTGCNPVEFTRSTWRASWSVIVAGPSEIGTAVCFEFVLLLRGEVVCGLIFTFSIALILLLESPLDLVSSEVQLRVYV